MAPGRSFSRRRGSPGPRSPRRGRARARRPAAHSGAASSGFVTRLGSAMARSRARARSVSMATARRVAGERLLLTLRRTATELHQVRRVGVAHVCCDLRQVATAAAGPLAQLIADVAVRGGVEGGPGRPQDRDLAFQLRPVEGLVVDGQRDRRHAEVGAAAALAAFDDGEARSRRCHEGDAHGLERIGVARTRAEQHVESVVGIAPAAGPARPVDRDGEAPLGGGIRGRPGSMQPWSGDGTARSGERPRVCSVAVRARDGTAISDG